MLRFVETYDAAHPPQLSSDGSIVLTDLSGGDPAGVIEDGRKYIYSPIIGPPNPREVERLTDGKRVPELSALSKKFWLIQIRGKQRRPSLDQAWELESRPTILSPAGVPVSSRSQKAYSFDFKVCDFTAPDTFTMPKSGRQSPHDIGVYRYDADHENPSGMSDPSQCMIAGAGVRGDSWKADIEFMDMPQGNRYLCLAYPARASSRKDYEYGNSCPNPQWLSPYGPLAWEREYDREGIIDCTGNLYCIDAYGRKVAAVMKEFDNRRGEMSLVLRVGEYYVTQLIDEIVVTYAVGVAQQERDRKFGIELANE
jgi:hypothetical protein